MLGLFLGLAHLFVSLRVYVKTFLSKSWGADDYLLVASLVSYASQWFNRASILYLSFRSSSPHTARAHSPEYTMEQVDISMIFPPRTYPEHSTSGGFASSSTLLQQSSFASPLPYSSFGYASNLVNAGSSMAL